MYIYIHTYKYIYKYIYIYIESERERERERERENLSRRDGEERHGRDSLAIRRIAPPPALSASSTQSVNALESLGLAILTPTSIKFDRFLKLILLEHKPLLACFSFVTRQKWLISKKINSRKRLNSIDVGAEI